MRRSRELLVAAAVIAASLATTSCWSARCYGKKADRLPDFRVDKNHDYRSWRDYCDTVDGALRVSVINEGFAAGACAVLVEYANGDWAEAVTEVIPAGEQRQVLLPTPSPWPDGGMSYRITLNPGDEVAEHRYGNNVVVGYAITLDHDNPDDDE